MEPIFTWKTIESGCFEIKASFQYGDTISENDISSFNSIHEDLSVIVTITPKKTIPALSTILKEQEKAGMVIRWIGDNKFSGCSNVQGLDFIRPVNLTCTIPKGYCSSSLMIECNVIVTDPTEIKKGEWYRPPGSIIASIPVLEKVILGKGNLFPILEYEGDGRNLIRWEFSSNEDLTLTPASSLMVLIDRKHSLIAATPENKERDALIMLMIIQGIVKKALSGSVYEQLAEKEVLKEKWELHSLGSSLSMILSKLCSQLNVNSFKALKEIYTKRPEVIDECVDKTFSNVLVQK